MVVVYQIHPFHVKVPIMFKETYSLTKLRSVPMYCTKKFIEFSRIIPFMEFRFSTLFYTMIAYYMIDTQKFPQ